MKKGSVIFPRASRAQLVDNLSTTLNRKQSIMINIAQDNDTTPVELDKLFTQEEQKALEERGFLGAAPAPYLDTAETILPKPALIYRKSIDEMLREMINEQIDKRVEEKVAAIMQSHATMALISDEQGDIMKQMVVDAIDEHESNHDHDGFCTRGQAEEIAEEALIETNIENAVKRTISHSNIVEDIVETAIDDIDWEEKVREGLVNILG